VFEDPSSITVDSPHTKIDSFEVYPDGYTRIAGRILVKWKDEYETAITINPSIKFRDSNVIFNGTPIQLNGDPTKGDGGIHFVSYDPNNNILTLVPELFSVQGYMSDLTGFNYTLEGYKADDATIPVEGYTITSCDIAMNGVISNGSAGFVPDYSKYDSSHNIADEDICTYTNVSYIAKEVDVSDLGALFKYFTAPEDCFVFPGKYNSVDGGNPFPITIYVGESSSATKLYRIFSIDLASGDDQFACMVPLKKG